MFENVQGLKTNEVEEKLKQFGPNSLPQEPQKSNLGLIVTQIKNPLAAVLLIAGIITVVINHIPDASIIFLSLLINTVLGFIQEKKANESFNALKKLLVQNALVIRNGMRITVETSLIVPGDIIVLSPGTKVPADGKLLHVNRLLIDEAIMTGESLAVAKKDGEEVFMGTTIVAGQALMEVTTTGAKTKIGAIAKDVQSVEPQTPLTRELVSFSKKLVVIIVSLITFVFVIGVIRGRDLFEMFTTAVALAVSAVPEGLVVSMTVVLAMGMQRILKKQGLVRKLASAETLGSVTTICVDKTGTLTEGKMQVVSFDGSIEDIGRQVMLANDLDDPLVISAYNWAKENLPDFKKTEKRLDSIPFSSKERLFVSLNKHTKDKNIIYVNGAPDILLNYTNLTKSEKQKILLKLKELTRSGKRLMGLAYKTTSKSKTSLEISDAKKDLTWVGLIAFSDPIRPSVKDAIEKAKAAGIKVVVITGDYPDTARFVLKEIGIKLENDQVLLGSDIKDVSLDALSQKISNVVLFARTTPDQKQIIVEAFQKRGEVVAMMGDGVNDAQAIHKSDIGIVVSNASDVARESADLILLDSDFSTIISCVEEGRSIFDNIRKIILYLLSGAFVEIFVVIGSIILNLPLPIAAVQIIWINLVSDGFPGLALTVDPKRNQLMAEAPRSKKEKLVNSWMVYLIGTVSLFAGGIGLITFVVTYSLTKNIQIAQSMTFITLGLNSLAYVFSVRSLLVPFWKNNLFENKYLVLSVLLGLFLQFVPFMNSTTQRFFRVQSLSLGYWMAAICFSVAVFVAVEIFKIFYRKN